MIMPAPFYPGQQKDQNNSIPMSRKQFISALTKLGQEMYHSLHPFHKLLHTGKLSHGQVQAWALNRYYYQCSIPRKDLTLMARIDDVELRLEWRSRVIDHEGDIDGKGGIKRYLQLCERLDLNLNYVKSCKGLLPASKFAVDAISKGMRLDLNNFNIKVTSINPGLVETEFSMIRFKNNIDKARNVYKGMQPLKANDIAEIIDFIIKRPDNICISDISILPKSQASSTVIKRSD